MKNLFFVLALYTVFPGNLCAQELKIFELQAYPKGNNEYIPLISLSDVHDLSDHPDSLAVPSLEDTDISEKENHKYFKLDDEYRKKFLAGTGVSETDQIFIYNYSTHVLLAFTVKNIPVVAALNVYGADWPYKQYDYMIGFELDKKALTGFNEYYANTVVYVGKEHPFDPGHLKHIVWKKIPEKDFPSQSINPRTLAEAKKQGFNPSKYTKTETHKYEADGFLYYIQELEQKEKNMPKARRLIVLSAKNKALVYETVYMESEGSSLAPLNEQWTGKLFRNKPPVIFGFEYLSFSCPDISFLSMPEKYIPIYCDNRH